MSTSVKDQDTDLARAKKLLLPVRSLLASLSDEDRIELFRELEEGYCRACGQATEWVCHCENDE